jgi:hypothetical protein
VSVTPAWSSPNECNSDSSHKPVIAPVKIQQQRLAGIRSSRFALMPLAHIPNTAKKSNIFTIKGVRPLWGGGVILIPLKRMSEGAEKADQKQKDHHNAEDRASSKPAIEVMFSLQLSSVGLTQDAGRPENEHQNQNAEGDHVFSWKFHPRNAGPTNSTTPGTSRRGMAPGMLPMPPGQRQ